MRSLFFLVGLFIMLSSVAASAQSFNTGADPARLRDIEPVVVQLIYVIWGVGTLALTILLMKIGFEYMTSLGDAQKQQEVREKGSKWLISLLIFFLAYPIILTFYNVTGIGDSNSNCYQDIRTPGFKFFFPTVCTDPQASSDKYGIGADCSGFSFNELKTIRNSNCCLDGGVVIPVNEFVGKRSNPDGTMSRLYKYDNSNGVCSQVDSCTTVGGREQCSNSVPQYVYDSSENKLIGLD